MSSFQWTRKDLLSLYDLEAQEIQADEKPKKIKEDKLDTLILDFEKINHNKSSKGG